MYSVHCMFENNIHSYEFVKPLPLKMLVVQKKHFVHDDNNFLLVTINGQFFNGWLCS